MRIFQELMNLYVRGLKLKVDRQSTLPVSPNPFGEAKQEETLFHRF